MLEKLAGIVSLPTSKTLMTVRLRVYDIGYCNVFDFEFKKRKIAYVHEKKQRKALHKGNITYSTQYAFPPDKRYS